MWAAAVIAVALIAAGLAFGVWVVALPLALVVAVVAAAMTYKRRRSQTGRVQELREQARTADPDARDVEFSDRDHRTLSS